MSSDHPVPRDRALDAFRGLAIVTMVAANFLADKARIPAWLKHAPDVGYTVIDLIAPLFVVAMAISWQYAAERRETEPRGGQTPGQGGLTPAEKCLTPGRGGLTPKKGGLSPSMHGIRRGLALIGIGAIFSAGESLALGQAGLTDWGVLQALGIVGISLTLTGRLRPWLRLALAFLILLLYQALMPLTKDLILARSHGGIIGAVAWTAMGLLALSSIQMVPRQRSSPVAAIALGYVVLGLSLSRVAPVSKNRVSTSYLLISLGLSLLLYQTMRFLYSRGKNILSWLEPWGRQPLLLYIAHQILLALFVLVPWPWWHEDASLVVILAQASLLFVLLSLLARYAEKKGLAIVL